ncbi:hypothetical protein EMPS_04448 [Entomortierella parvispora]|uniref:Uncharacterized protein n=1 Tax=Entomortierella parvispora TaxID=205924 RepID=A0A9P3H8N5_9FUNG|nr:hypothetical protein EMPS_04448 [Entomortierella parvispora]
MRRMPTSRTNASPVAPQSLFLEVFNDPTEEPQLPGDDDMNFVEIVIHLGEPTSNSENQLVPLTPESLFLEVVYFTEEEPQLPDQHIADLVVEPIHLGDLGDLPGQEPQLSDHYVADLMIGPAHLDGDSMDEPMAPDTNKINPPNE